MADRTALLEGDDFENCNLDQSLLYKVNWVAHQTRPEAAGVVSLLASRLHQATIHDLSCLNKMVHHLRTTAKQPLILHKFGSEKIVFVAACDAGGICGKPVLDNAKDTVQGAWAILASESIPASGEEFRPLWLEQHFHTLGELEWLQIMFRDAVFGDVQ